MNNSIDTTPDQVEYAIEAKGLSKRFGNNIAVNKLDLKIPKGSIYGFLGPNGCGKSTSIRLLTGLLSASEGDVSILGKDVNWLYDTKILFVRQSNGTRESQFCRCHLWFLW